MSQERNKSTADSGAPRPFWIPPGLDFDRLPEALQAAITEIVEPMYRELVVQARNGLEKGTGLTVVHLCCLEILDQIQLGRSTEDAASTTKTAEDRCKLIAQHLRLVQAKIKASGFLHRLQKFRLLWGSGLALLEPTPIDVGPPGGWVDPRTEERTEELPEGPPGGWDDPQAEGLPEGPPEGWDDPQAEEPPEGLPEGWDDPPTEELPD